MTTKNITKTESQVKAIEKQSEQLEIKNLKKFIDIEQQKRNVLKEYISNNLVEGTDYGKIHMGRGCQDKYNCKIPGHFSKPCLFKGGSEKFLSLMHLRPTFKKDVETWEMAGSKPGLFAYICLLLDSKETVVGEGRGSSEITERSGWTINNAIKIAEKRAQLDAVLRTGGLSDFFTQDLEDQPMEATRPTAQPAQTTKPMAIKATEFQLKKIFALLPERGKVKEELYNAYQINSLKDLTIAQANNIISRLESMPIVGRKTTENTTKQVENTQKEPKTAQKDDVDVEEIAKGMEAEKVKEENQPAKGFEMVWLRQNAKELIARGLIKDESMIDFISEKEYRSIFLAFTAKK